ncbi:16S rRNA (guanine(966)-N(2))-methyltransferase RsmD [Melissococcus plutonius]|uniref:Ribosomal RNA small subunit methyltransferase D n=2 Tax=Melissococcus plutonius TaxID=33970 RepID=F3YB25_MELPT|nr:16S rRNA (guanine(966)-N(2))-methyltransferase RsmD [Melissococcus plutonius]BAL61947.1 ribosomal RNA small subunit methyltransferase D [Melissococcus plutonius DAT561]AIM25133.1 ribosomal RNA small subunit methyltransferase D [Melissococcus plutonius S1]KMT25383.1 ribosomal RNA small subunit methyltransferase D [Melissococcus plutonius]KMT25652.1 ribosomal RNA small subunit methyltransferase D [Melissococcus plutonius]KMT26287.1 ribosomal RNA small subunit methyltransferase D [Melissococcu
MRIISGIYKGRRLKTLKNNLTRPTTDKVKGAIFNVIGPYFDGGVVLDLFSGSGNLAIEAISRGMEKAVCVDKNYEAIKIIKENVANVDETGKFIIKKSDAQKALIHLKAENRQFDLVFLDPPYAEQKIIQQVEQLSTDNLLAEEALVVCETDKMCELPVCIAQLKQIRKMDYGITKITIYKREVPYE